MSRHNEQWFGVVIEPGPHETRNNSPVTIQLMTGRKGDETNRLRVGPKFPATQVSDLAKTVQHAQKMLDTDYVKKPEGYLTRNGFF